MFFRNGMKHCATGPEVCFLSLGGRAGDGTQSAALCIQTSHAEVYGNNGDH